jgi:Suppressor of fused protein (SUFU)
MAWQEWFERVWADREENVFPRLFGPEPRGVFTLSHSIFLETFKQPSFDPRWCHYGVFEFRPTTSRSSWLYVTSGMSNAWEDDEPRADGPSGFGCEFVLETTEQGEWAILRMQHLMAFQILLENGRYLGRDPLTPYDRIPLRASITPEPSKTASGESSTGSTRTRLLTLGCSRRQAKRRQRKTLRTAKRC